MTRLLLRVAAGNTKAWSLSNITGAKSTVAPADTPVAIANDGVSGGRKTTTNALHEAKQRGPVRANKAHPTMSGAGRAVSGISTNSIPAKPSNTPIMPERRNFSMRKKYDIR